MDKIEKVLAQSDTIADRVVGALKLEGYTTEELQIATVMCRFRSGALLAQKGGPLASIGLATMIDAFSSATVMVAVAHKLNENRVMECAEKMSAAVRDEARVQASELLGKPGDDDRTAG